MATVVVVVCSKERSISPSPSSAYLGQSQSRRSSVQSVNGLSEPQEVSSVHVNFVKDNSRYWYKPNIAREDGNYTTLIIRLGH